MWLTLFVQNYRGLVQEIRRANREAFLKDTAEQVYVPFPLMTEPVAEHDASQFLGLWRSTERGSSEDEVQGPSYAAHASFALDLWTFERLAHHYLPTVPRPHHSSTRIQDLPPLHIIPAALSVIRYRCFLVVSRRLECNNIIVIYPL